MRPKPIHISAVKGRVHAAIITIRHDEYDAVESRLEDPVPVTGGNNNYEVATVQPDHGGPISVALTRCVRQGNLSAQAVANNIIQDLDPAWLLLVGIAGGVSDNEFSLGDVILASALHDFSFGAATQGGGRTYQIGGGPMHAEVDRFLQTKIVGRNRDQLIDLADFNTRDKFIKHPPLFLPGKDLRSSVYGETDFQEKSFDTISRRFPGGNRIGGVRVWSGPCANGDLLVKDTALLATWQQVARQIVHVETELAGVYEAARNAGRQNYPVLAIRGLSDIVGLKRNPDWTQYACDSAAAFACAILRSGFIDFSTNLPNPKIGSPETAGATPVSRSYIAPKIAAGILQSDLFATLKDLLKATSPPSAECLRDQWQHYLRAHSPVLAAEALSTLLAPPTSQIKALLTAYEWALAAHDDALIPAKSPASTYVEACAASLRGAGSVTVVPFVLVDKPGSGLVLEFVFETHLSHGSGLFCHPSSTSCEVMLGQHFVQGLLQAWSLSAPSTGELDRTVFWSVRRADGSSELPTFFDGGDSFANGAAFLAFWHLRRGLCLDDDVYIAAECQVDGSVRTTGGLSTMITAIEQHRNSFKQEAPATIVIAATITSQTPQDDTAIARASTWAEVKTVATTAELSAVRSCTAGAVIAYMEHLAQTLDETPWMKDGKIVRLSDVHVPPHVWKTECSLNPAAEDERGGSERDWRPASYAPQDADREVRPRLKLQRRKVRVPWTTEFQRTQQQRHPIVIVGGPGIGKTSLLRWTAREMVLESLVALNACTKTALEVRWPIITDLAAWLGRTGQPRESLQESALAFAPLPEGCPVLHRQALALVMKSRLLDHEDYTHLFLDALDQVPVGRLRLLRERLDGLRSVGSRVVFSTREAALTTHLPLLSIPRLTILEAAALSIEDARALATKWLDSNLATRLQSHLRAKPAMSVVADSPLLLTLACGIVARSPNAELPETASYLYRALMQSLARGEWRDAGTDTVQDPDALLARLPPMAWRLFSREAGINLFSRDTLIRALNAGASSVDAQAEATLGQLCHLGFLEASGHSQDEPRYQFRHTTFLEFLAAAHLAAEINAEGWAQANVLHWHGANGWQLTNVMDMLDASAFERLWESLFIFVSGLLAQPKPLLEMLADRRKDDHYRHRLMLLYLCFGALATSKEDSLEAVLETGLRELRILGLKTVMRMPEMRRQWQANVKVIANLPKTGRRLASILVAVARRHSEMHMGGAEDIFKALSHPASKEGAENCLSGILALCVDLDVHIRGDEAADKLVTIASEFGLPKFLRQMLSVIEDAGDRPWLQIRLARSLLRCEETDIADRAVDVLVAIADNQQLDESPRWDAAVALIHGLEGRRAERIRCELCRMLLAKHNDETSEKVQQTIARWILPVVVPDVTDSRSAVLALATKRHLGSVYFEAETHWASDLVQNEDTAVRQIGLRHLTDRIKSGNHDDYTISFLVGSVLRAGHDADRKVVAELLRSRLTRPIGNGNFHLAAIQGLMELGEPYDRWLRHEMLRLADSPTIGTYALEELAKEARSLDDAELSNRIAIRFASLVNLDRNHDRAGESSSDDRRRAAKLLFGTPEWEPFERNAFARLRGHTEENKENWFSVNTVCFGAKSSGLIKLTEDLLAVGKWNFHPWVPLMRELALRGWRFRISRRKFVILRRGQEEPRADAECKY